MSYPVGGGFKPPRRPERVANVVLPSLQFGYYFFAGFEQRGVWMMVAFSDAVRMESPAPAFGLSLNISGSEITAGFHLNHAGTVHPSLYSIDGKLVSPLPNQNLDVGDNSLLCGGPTVMCLPRHAAEG